MLLLNILEVESELTSLSIENRYVLLMSDISKTGIETKTIIFDNSQIPVHWVVKNVHVCWV